MADDWQAGDEGVCIRDGDWRSVTGEPFAGPKKGDFIKVVQVVPDPQNVCCGKVFLELKAWPSFMWCSTGFRKLRPDKEPAKDGAAIAADIRRRVEEVAQ